MREIKFRVFDKQSKEMIYLETPKTFDNGLWFQSDKHIDSSDIEIMQYTGLKDCEGQEIYEGDIVKVNFKEYYSNEQFTIDPDTDEGIIKIGKVLFNSFTYFIEFLSSKSSIFLFEIDFTDIEIKVIGNIYQNPKLMEVQE